MRRASIVIALLVFVGFVAPCRAQIVRAAEFDADLEGWTASGADIAWDTGMASVVDSVNGVPPGSDPSLFWVEAPASFGGDWSCLERIELIVWSYGATIVRPVVVEISGPGGTATYEFPLSAISGSGANLLSRPLFPTFWDVSGSWPDLLADVTGMRIRLDLSDDSYEHYHLDEVHVRLSLNASLVTFNTGVPSRPLAGEFATLQEGVDSMWTGVPHAVFLMPGTHAVNATVHASHQPHLMPFQCGTSGDVVLEPDTSGVPIVSVQSGAKLQASNVTFHDGIAPSGGAILATGAPVNLYHCTFRNNRATSGSGGAVRVESHAPQGCTENSPYALSGYANVFEDNEAAVDGGAISVDACCNVYVWDSDLRRNHAHEGQGGAMAIEDTRFVDARDFDLSGNDAVRGGAVALTRVGADPGAIGDVSLYRMRFGELDPDDEIIGNSADDDGGGLYVQETETIGLSVHECEFLGGVAGGRGGAAFLEDVAHASFRLNEYRSNEAHDGGALALASCGVSGAPILIEGDTWGDADDPDVLNVALDEGGQVHSAGSWLEITEYVQTMPYLQQASTMRGGRASSGGAVHVSGPEEVKIHHSVLSHNEASDNGGGIALRDDANLVLEYATIENNRAGHLTFGYGGGLHAQGFETIRFEGLQFNENGAGLGAGMYVDGGTSLTMGTVYVQDSDIGYGAAAFVQNLETLTCTGGPILLRNDAPAWSEVEGGGLRIRDVETVTMRPITGFNSAWRGGAIDIARVGECTITNATHTSNEARDAGGALHVDDVEHLVIFNGAYRGNTATGLFTSRGGGAFLENIESLEILGFRSSFDNVASLGGGVLSILDCPEFAMTLTTSAANALRDNAVLAGGVGGVFEIVDSSGSINRGIFRDNAAPEGRGGAIAVSWGAAGGDVRIEGTTFRDNVAREGGAISAVSTGELGEGMLHVLSHSSGPSVLETNVADRFGGGIHLVDCVAEIGAAVGDVRFVGNGAAVGGGLAAIGTVASDGADSWRDGLLTSCGWSPEDRRSRGFVSITGASFEGNHAAIAGGGAAAVDPDATSTWCGDGLASDDAAKFGIRMDVRDATFSGNTLSGVDCTDPTCVSSPELPQCAGTAGAGVYYSGGGALGSRIAMTAFVGNGQGADGGGVALRNHAAACFEDCVFQANEVAHDGGGLSVAIQSRASVARCQFVENVAARNGGGLHAACSSRIHAEDSSWMSNRATGTPASDDGNGGGLFVRDGQLDMTGTGELNGNVAGRDGGGVMLWSVPDRAALGLCGQGIDELAIQGETLMVLNEAGLGTSDPTLVGAGGGFHVRREPDAVSPRVDIKGVTVTKNIAGEVAGVAYPVTLDGGSLSGLVETPASVIGFFRDHYGAGLAIADCFLDSSAPGGEAAVLDSDLEANGLGLLAVRSTVTVGGGSTFVGNGIGLAVEDCLGLTLAPPIRVSETTFRSNSDAGMATVAADVDLAASTFWGNATGLRVAHVSGTRVRAELCDFDAGPGGMFGVHFDVSSVGMPFPSSDDPTLAVEQCDFEAFTEAGALGYLLTPTDCAFDGLPSAISANDCYWGCGDWTDPPLSGGPRHDCWSPPPSASVGCSAVSAGVAVDSWASIPLVP